MDALEKLQAARVSLLFNQPFFAELAIRLKLVKTEMIPTAGVDGVHLFYNPKFINTLDKEECIFVVGHEVLHCAFDFFGRLGGRDKALFNMAQDYVINSILKQNGMKMPSVGLYNKKYEGWSSEDVYDDLVKNNAKPQKTLDVHMGDGLPTDKNGGSGDKPAEGSGQSGSQPCDCEGELEEIPETIAEEWKNAFVAAAQSAQQAGKMPVGMDRFIDDLVEPKIDWRQFIHETIRGQIKSDYNWLKPNKRTFGFGICMPTLDVDDSIEVVVSIDMSGSISQEQARDFFSELYGVMQQFTAYKIHVVCFDTKVYNYECFTEDDDLANYEPKGGGGTDFMVFWKWLEKQPWKKDIGKVLFFTDGYPCGEWGDDTVVEAETIWLVHGNTEIEAPFGVTLHYEFSPGD